uniref:Uncharacterized protein n=1 Tax=Varanus komodoensis TaxID=61221 RepID=A0A8D2L5G1_VARKO
LTGCSGRMDILWCFSQVKGTIDIGLTEGGFALPFVLGMKNLFPCTNCSVNDGFVSVDYMVLIT